MAGLAQKTLWHAISESKAEAGQDLGLRRPSSFQGAWKFLVFNFAAKKGTSWIFVFQTKTPTSLAILTFQKS